MKLPDTDARERLLVEAAQRDPTRFGDLYDAYFHRVYVYVARRVRRRDLTEDITSQVFHQALANLSRFEWRGISFAAWLFRIAANAISDQWKRTAREQGNPEPTASEEVFDPAHDETDERRAVLNQLVAKLPEDQRRVIQMRFAEEKSIREIARDLGRSEGAIKQLQFRALENLRAQMSKSNV